MAKIILTKSGSQMTATDERGHSVVLPISLDGVRLLATLLDGKELTSDQRLGSPFRPTQQMVDQFLTNRKSLNELKQKIDLENQTKSLIEDF